MVQDADDEPAGGAAGEDKAGEGEDREEQA